MKKTQLKTVVSAILATSLMMSAPAVTWASGIPTADVAAVGEAIKNGMMLKEQIDNQIEQIQKLKEQVQALSGLRDVGNIGKDVFKNADIPKELRNLYKQAGVDAGKGSAKNYKTTASTNQSLLSKQLENLSGFLEKNHERVKEINRLTNLAKNAADLKAAADLRNQISSYTAQLQNQQIEIENTERLYRMQKEVEQQQYHDMQACYTKYAAKGDYSACQK
ncbi:MAG: hypothetical protein D8B42_05055 [Kingella sp. (in: b-proteobacteria)]|jgi:tagB5|nr:MAG: hypothetical protein D8B42_05055 [Kingella sp. (in: b-proteobacteria)]